MTFKILKLLFGQKSLAQKNQISKVKLKQWEAEKVILEREAKIEKERTEIRNKRKENKLPSAKKFLIFLFINSVILELGVGWVTYSSFKLAFSLGVPPDLSPLVALIGIIIGQTISYGVYSNKSKAENTEGGIIYDLAMTGIQNKSNDNGVG